MLKQLDFELSLKQLDFITTFKGSYFYNSYFLCGINCTCKLEVSENLPTVFSYFSTNLCEINYIFLSVYYYNNVCGYTERHVELYVLFLYSFE